MVLHQRPQGLPWRRIWSSPFDASKELKKLASWDSPPSDAEMEQIAPLLTRIQALKGGKGGALLGIQLMAFFVQRRVQPLQHRLTKLWSYSGLEDPSRISEDLTEKQDVDNESGASPSSPRTMRLLNWPLVISTPCTPYPRYIFVCFCTLVIEFICFELCLSLPLLLC
jgi:hypothetical protein